MGSVGNIQGVRDDNRADLWSLRNVWDDNDMQSKAKKSKGSDKGHRHTPPSARSSHRMRVDYILNDDGDEGIVGSTFLGRSNTPKSVIWDDLGEGLTTGGGISSSLSTSPSGRKHKHNSTNPGGAGPANPSGVPSGAHESGMGGKTGGGGKEKKFECNKCGFAFGMKSNLKRHVMTVHEDRRCWRCDICGAAFGLKQNLGTHVRVKHEKRRPFVCDVCSVGFGYKQVLQNHRRNIHGLGE